MKKLLMIAMVTLLSFSFIGCQPDEKSTPTVPDEESLVTAEYLYNRIETEDVEGIQFFKDGELTPLMEDQDDIREVTTLIQQAEFIENVDPQHTVEGQWGGILHLNTQILDSNQVILRYADQENQLYIGPEGREYLIESQDLLEFIKGGLESKVLLVEERTVPQEAREWFSGFIQEKGAYVYQHPDATYVKVVAGQKPTGGYGIHLREYNEDEYPQEIIIEIIEPAEDEVVTQAITFPTIYIRIDSDSASQYEVKTVDGELYELENKLIFAKLEEPQEDVEIDNPVRIKGKIIAFEGAFVVRILEESGEILHEEHLQSDHGGPNWGRFDEEISYPQANTNRGSIELGEYSAKDGTYQLRERIEVRFK